MSQVTTSDAVASSVPLRRRVRQPFGETRSKLVQCRVTPTEYEQLQAAAELAGGKAVGSYLGGVAQDVALNRPLRPVEVIGELVAARQALRRVGSNVNQIAAAVNSGADLPGNTSVVMDRLLLAIERLEDAADEVGRCYE